MLNRNDILETINMIDQQHLDIRTITMGISLLSCADPDPKAACRKMYETYYSNEAYVATLTRLVNEMTE